MISLYGRLARHYSEDKVTTRIEVTMVTYYPSIEVTTYDQCANIQINHKLMLKLQVSRANRNIAGFERSARARRRVLPASCTCWCYILVEQRNTYYLLEQRARQ